MAPNSFLPLSAWLGSPAFDKKKTVLIQYDALFD
jgi:hypothetical protein